MNVEIGAEAALFPEKEYINGIAVAVWLRAHEKDSGWLRAQEKGTRWLRAQKKVLSGGSEPKEGGSVFT